MWIITLNHSSIYWEDEILKLESFTNSNQVTVYYFVLCEKYGETKFRLGYLFGFSEKDAVELLTVLTCCHGIKEVVDLPQLYTQMIEQKENGN